MANTLTSTQVQGVVDGRFAMAADPLRTNVVHVKYSSNGTSISSGDVVQFIAIPAWARITGGMVIRTTTPTDSMIYGLGYTGGTAFAAAGSFSTTTGVAMNRVSTNLGTILSISEAAALQFDTLDLAVTSLSACVTCDLHVWVSYTYEPNKRS